MARKKYILLSLVSRKKLIKEPYGRDILSLFYDKYSTLTPQFANSYQPVNNPVNKLTDGLEYWDWNTLPLLFKRKNIIAGSWYISEDFDKISGMIFEYNWSPKIDWYSLFKELVKASEAYFGYIHVFTDQEIEPSAVGSAISCFTRGTPGVHLKKGIPNLGWAHYFGEEYVKEVDIPLLQKHGFEVEPLGEGYTFHITDKLSDVIDNYEYFDERRKLLKSLFRPELFQKYEPFA